MKRRLLAAVAALVLVLVGSVVLLAYAESADQRAMAGLKTVRVLVVDAPVPAGTPADELAELVTTELLPAKAAAPGRVTDLDELAGQVATVDLEPGEQLLAARFVEPEDLSAPGTAEVPEGEQEVSVLLEPQRAVGGQLTAGDTVGIYLSVVYQDGRSNTSSVLHQVLVTRVQGAPATPDPEATTDTAASTGVPAESLLVTLAVTAEEAETVIFGMEHGTIWLSLEPADADTTGTRVVDQSNVYTGVAR